MPLIRLRRGREFALGDHRYRLEDCSAKEAVIHVSREDGLEMEPDEIDYKPRRIPPKQDEYRPPVE
jgi:hypothetical protein